MAWVPRHYREKKGVSQRDPGVGLGAWEWMFGGVGGGVPGCDCVPYLSVLHTDTGVIGVGLGEALLCGVEDFPGGLSIGLRAGRVGLTA